MAESVGWLNIVDGRIVANYLDPTSAAQRLLNDLFGDYGGFMTMSRTPITCVEVAYRDGFVAVRNSKDPSKKMVFFTYEEWQVFLHGVKVGRFELPDDAQPSSTSNAAPCCRRAAGSSDDT
jgi:hypothetical protein